MNEATDLRTKADLHIARKIWHMLAVFTMAVVYHISPLWLSYLMLVTLGGLLILLDFLRLKFASVNAFTVKVMGPLMRKSEVNSIAGTTSLIIGVLFIVSIFDRHIVELSLLFLAFADPGASYFGLRFGKDKLWNGKSLQGSVAAFAICSIIAMIYYSMNGIMAERIVVVSLLSGLAGSLAEATPFANLDDNFLMPTISAGGLWLIFSIFGGFLV